MCLLDPPVLCLWPSSGAVVAWSLDFVALGHSRWAVPGGSVNGGISVIIHFNWMFSINHPLGVSPSMETHPPKWMVYFMERSRSKMDDDWGGTPFSEDSSKSRKCMNSKKHLLVLITQGTLTIIVVWWFDIVWFQLLCDLRRIWGSRQRGLGWRIAHPGVHGDTIRIIMEYITKKKNIYIGLILRHLARSWWNMVKCQLPGESVGICFDHLIHSCSSAGMTPRGSSSSFACWPALDCPVSRGTSTRGSNKRRRKQQILEVKLFKWHRRWDSEVSWISPKGARFQDDVKNPP